MTVDEVKQWLNRGYRLEQLIKLDKQKIKELEELSTTLSGFNSSERVQNSPNLEAKYQKYIFDKDKRINLLKQRIKAREEILQEVDKVINSLDDNLEIEILSYRYLRFMSFREISEITYFSIGKCFKVHDEAIKKLSFMKEMNANEH